MVKRISETQEKSMYFSWFMDGWHDQQKKIDGLFEPSMLCTDGTSNFLSYTLLTQIIMRLLYMICVVERAESSLVANGPAIEVYPDDDPAFSGQCLRKYCCQQELNNCVMKGVVMVSIVYTVLKALEINDKFCGMQIAAVAVKFTNIINYKDAFHSDRISKGFVTASHKCQQSEQEVLNTIIQRKYRDEIEADYSIPSTLKEWEVWKEEMLDSIEVRFISSDT